MDGSAAEQFRAQLALHVWGLCRRQTPFDRVPDTPGDHRNLEEILLIVHRIRQTAICRNLVAICFIYHVADT
jgi:hypothetical protein